MITRKDAVLTIDVSQALDANLEAAFRATDFEIDRCGSEVAVMHKLRSINAFLVVFENKRPPKPEPIYEILDEARATGVPMILVSYHPLEPERKRILSYLMKVMEPPIYPYQLFRDVKSFQWREETVYVVRNPGKRAQEFTIAVIARQRLEDDHLETMRSFFTQRGNRFMVFERPEAATDILANQKRALAFYVVDDDALRGRDMEQAKADFANLKAAIGQGGVVPLFPAAGCVPKTTFPFLVNGAVTVLPWPAPAEDLRELYDSLRFLR